MKYKVVHRFRDLQDNDHIYKVGDTYPRKEIKIEDVSPERIQELSGTQNKIGKILIEAEKEEKQEVKEKEATTEKEKTKTSTKTKNK